MEEYEVISIYPNSPYLVGTILKKEITDYYSYNQFSKKWTANIKNINNYPHIFKPINNNKQ